MKSSLTDILKKQIVGKKVVENHSIHENYWGKTIIDVRPCSYNYGNDIGYIIQVDIFGGCDVFIINTDFQLEVE